MASFVETQPYQFNPYVQTLPVEDMVKVGMIKQEQYNAGVQKARSYLQSIADIDVIKPEHVKYVEEAFNTVKSQLRSVASQDFSNQQLVNSVAGLAKQVHSDKNIQNMLSDTMWWRKQYQNMETAIEKGESGPANEWDLMDGFEKWYGDGNATTRFRKRYSKYVDVDKEWMETLKGLTANGTIKDIPFVTFVDPATGQIMATDKIARVMMEQKIEGVSPEQIENALRATMNPNVENQLSISGRYKYRGLDAAGMEENSKARFKSISEDYQKRLKDAEEDLKNYSKGSSQYTRLLEVVDGYKRMIGADGTKGKLQEQLESEIEMIQKDPEFAKGYLYKNFAIRGFSDAFSWKKTSVEYKESPWEKNAQSDRDLALKLRTQDWNERMDIEELKVESLKAKAAAKAAGLPGYGGGMITEVGAGAEDVPSPYEAIIADKQAYSNAMVNDGNELMKSLNISSVDELNSEIDKFLKADPKNPSKIPFNARSTVYSYLRNKTEGEAIANVVDVQEAKARAEVGNKYAKPEQLLAGRANLTIRTPNGEKYTYTPKEVYDFLRKENIETGGVQGPGASVATSKTTIKESQLSPKERVLYNQWKKRYNQETTLGSSGLARLDDVSEAYIKSIKGVFDQGNAYDAAVRLQFNKNMQPYVGAWTAKKEGIDVTKDNLRENAINITNNFLSSMGADKGSRVYGSVNYSELNSWLTDKNTRNVLSFEHVVQGNNNEWWIKKGNDIAKIKLSPTEAQQLPSTIRSDDYTAWVQKRQSLSGGTTGINGSPSGAAITPVDFKNVHGVVPYANYVTDMKNPEINYISLILQTDQGFKSVMLEKPFSVAAARGYVNGVSAMTLLKDARQAAQNQKQFDTVAAIDEILSNK